jgi:hypothetical protein
MCNRAGNAVTGLSQKSRLTLALLLTALSLAVIGVSFWRQDWQYSLPTPRPAGLHQVSFGSTISLSPVLARFKRPHRPLFLRFLNSHCPCSQFNSEHVRSLAQRFGSEVDFVAVVQSQISAREVQAECAGLHLVMPIVLDKDGQIGLALGVYSTPQAVLLNNAGQLYFRGNYNVSRYCADESTEFARLALTALVNGGPLPAFPRAAVIAYGCPLRRPRIAPGRGDL